MQAAGAGEWAGAARAAGRCALQQEAVVGAAEQLVLPQRELVAGQQLAAAHGAAEALDVIHTVPRPHHQIAAAEAHLALGALDAEQPAGPRRGRCQQGARGPPRFPGCNRLRARKPRTLCGHREFVGTGPRGVRGPDAHGGTRSEWGVAFSPGRGAQTSRRLQPQPPQAVAEPRLSRASPDIVPLAVGLPVSHEARARLVQVLAALGALEAGGMPLQVGRHPQDKLVVDLTPAAHAHGSPGLLCRGRARGPRQAGLPGSGRASATPARTQPARSLDPVQELRLQGKGGFPKRPNNWKRKTKIF